MSIVVLESWGKKPSWVCQNAEGKTWIYNVMINEKGRKFLEVPV